MNEIDEIHLDAYKSTALYKEKKKWHDQCITRRDFKVSEKVLVFNPRLQFFPVKLKSRWPRPYTVTQVFSYGSPKVTRANGPFNINCPRVMHYFASESIGDKEVMIFET